MRSSVHSVCKLVILASVIRLYELAIVRGKRQLNGGRRDLESTTVSSFLYMTPASGEHNGFWKISRSEIYDNLPSSDLNDLTELTVFFHDDGVLAGESEFRNLRYQVSKLNFHIDSAPTINEISQFGIHNYTFFQTRFRYTKANAGTHHIKHWLAHSNSPYLYLTIKQLGEADNNRFTSSSVKPVILLTRNTHQPTIQHRSKRTVYTDGSELTRRRCEDFSPGYTGCCLREHIVYLRDQIGPLTTTTDLPNGPTSIRVCKGTCTPSIHGESIADRLRERSCNPTGIPVTLDFSLNTDSGSSLHRIKISDSACACGA